MSENYQSPDDGKKDEEITLRQKQQRLEKTLELVYPVIQVSVMW